MSRAALAISLLALALAGWSARPQPAPVPDPRVGEVREWAPKANQILLQHDKRLVTLEKEVLLRTGEK